MKKLSILLLVLGVAVNSFAGIGEIISQRFRQPQIACNSYLWRNDHTALYWEKEPLAKSKHGEAEIYAALMVEYKPGKCVETPLIAISSRFKVKDDPEIQEWAVQRAAIALQDDNFDVEFFQLDGATPVSHNNQFQRGNHKPPIVKTTGTIFE
jgi:hypothetical protein